MLTTLCTPLDIGVFDGTCANSPAEPPGGYEQLMQSCLASDALTNTAFLLGAGGGGGGGGAGAGETRFTMRIQCRPAFLDGLEWTLDGIFFADIVLKFFTAVPIERSLEMKCGTVGAEY